MPAIFRSSRSVEEDHKGKGEERGQESRRASKRASSIGDGGAINQEGCQGGEGGQELRGIYKRGTEQ